MFSVLVADDEKAIRESIKDYLEAKGYSVKTATDGESALELFYENSFDLVILDVMMPKVDGFDACRAVRRASNLPVLFLTAKGQEADFLKGFECGCDDYVVKPFPLSVLYEKCNSLIKRYKGIDSANWLKVSGVALDLSCKRAYVGENEIKLSSKDFKILCKLKGLEVQKTEAENLEIVQLVRAMRLTPQELNAMLSGGGIPGMTAAPAEENEQEENADEE